MVQAGDEGLIVLKESNNPVNKYGHQRELIKILLQMVTSEEYESYLLDVCITIWKKIADKPSVGFNAFKMIVKIAKGNPDLANEIELLTQNQYMESLSSSTQKSIYKMLGEIKPKENIRGNNLSYEKL